MVTTKQRDGIRERKLAIYTKPPTGRITQNSELSGAKSGDPTEIMVKLFAPSEKTCQQKLWVAKSELCFILIDFKKIHHLHITDDDVKKLVDLLHLIAYVDLKNIKLFDL